MHKPMSYVVWAALMISAGCGGSGPPPPLPPSGNCPTCCPDWGCGTNGAWLGQGVVFHDLDASGLKFNSAGLKIRTFHDATGHTLAVEVDHDRLRGVRNDGTALEESALIGSTFELIDRQEQVYDLTITNYGTTTYWVDGDREVPVYGFEFADSDTPEKRSPLCRPPSDGGTAWQPISGMAVIFRGDRYDAVKKTVVETGGGDTWFNIACAGTTVAKMHLLRHSWASNEDGAHPTTVPQRQAVLKMLVADYCGDGRPFTVDGHVLSYTYDQSWELPVDWSAVQSIDALWGPAHALCLNQPRLHDQFSTIRSAIVSHCASIGYTIKGCKAGLMGELKAAAPGDHPWAGYAVSANPGP